MGIDIEEAHEAIEILRKLTEAKLAQERYKPRIQHGKSHECREYRAATQRKHRAFKRAKTWYSKHWQ